VTATLPDRTARRPRPDRVVDRYQRGWITTDDPCRTYPRLDDRAWTLADLEAERAPLRPVVAVTADDRELLADTLTGAGHAAGATVIAALYVVSQRCYKVDGSDARLIAGRPESWENRMLPRFAWEVGINLTGRRVEPRALRTIDSIINTWIFAEHSYVEVAGSLALAFADVVATAEGDLERFTDQWLRHGTLGEEIVRFLTLKL
jgi:hypothetical protein